MMSRNQLDAFRTAPRDSLPDVHDLDEEAQVLWVLALAKSLDNTARLSHSEISDILCDVCGIALPRQKIAAIVKRLKGKVDQNRKGGRRTYKLMKLGEDQLSAQTAPHILVDPERPLSSIRRLEIALAPLQGSIAVCDPYISPRTFDLLAAIEKASDIRLLTENVQDGARVRRDAAAFAKEQCISLEIRISSGELHDRYIVHDNGALLVGASLKDFAKRQSMVVMLSATVGDEMRKAFGRIWARSSLLS